MQSQARLIQARSLTSFASRSHSGDRAMTGALRPSSRVLIDSNLDKSTPVDTLTHVDMRTVKMLRLFRKSKERLVEFCDRCARVCDGRCRAVAIRERALMQALRVGVRV
jgi:hypothetical protein